LELASSQLGEKFVALAASNIKAKLTWSEQAFSQGQK
tara:strand:+ start:664 stop:774 length:111 start_codon:yes stop_codon:yes gene_type:complete